MTAPFAIDLTRPGWAQRSRWEWFLGPDGLRHLAIMAGAGVALVALVALGGVLPRYLRYSGAVQSIAKLRREVATAGEELSTLRMNLHDLGAEARRQVRWSEMLAALSRWVPGTLRIERVSLGKAARQSQGQPPSQGAAMVPGDLTLQIEGSTTMVPGSSRLVELANFMTALAQDPAVAPRFQLKTWEVRPARDQGGEERLHISIGLAEKRP
jgi:Tfp pilus assembly protein PilN